jgi:hemoglobin/transferrin/lactoferrin receptor protein
LEVTITDSDKNPLIGVLVFSNQNTFSAASDENGQVAIEYTQESDIFNFQYITYKSEKFSVKDLIANPNIQLKAEKQILDEVIVIGRMDQSKEELPYIIETISAEDIALTNPQTSADAMAQHGNVFVQKSQMGGGSPVIRGFEANKVLLVVDGVRMNNAIYRNGHLQNSISIDQAILERTELIFGPNSLLYGSDALGGVVHFRTKNPELSNTNKVKSNANLYARFSSANKEKNFHGDFNFGFKKLAFLTSFTYANFGDLRVGGNRPVGFEEFGKRNQYVATNNGEDEILNNEDPNTLIGTGYKQYDFLQKVLFQANPDWQIIGNFQYSTSSDIPRYDELSVIVDDTADFAEWNYGPQKRVLGSVRSDWFSKTPLFDKASLILSYQSVEESRIVRRFKNPLRNSQIENLDLFAINSDFQKILGKQSVSYGFEYTYNDLRSTANNFNIQTTEQTNALTRYPSGGSDMSTFSIFANYNRRMIDSLIIFNAGVRYNRFTLNAAYDINDPFEWPENYYTGIQNQNDAFTAAAGLTLQNDKILVRAQIASAFRNPNIDDFAKIRIKRNDATVPNVLLDSEKAFNMEATFAYFFDKQKRSKLSITAFRSNLKDAIIRTDFALPNGDRIVQIDGESFNVQANVNAENGFIYGISANGELANQIWKLKGSINYTKGRTKDENGLLSPLAHIPPLYGQISLSYQKNKVNLRLVNRFNGSKPLNEYGGSADNPDFATSEGSLAWNTFNIYSNIDISDVFQLSLGLENVLDTHYRTFSSGLSASGINAIIALRSRL